LRHLTYNIPITSLVTNIEFMWTHFTTEAVLSY